MSDSFRLMKNDNGTYNLVLMLRSEFSLQSEYEIIKQNLSESIAFTMIKEIHKALAKDSK